MSPLGTVAPPAGRLSPRTSALPVDPGPVRRAGCRPGWSAWTAKSCRTTGVAVGELEVRGPWIAASYFRVDDPDKFHDGWLRTGDIGNLTPDGYLTLTDRAKDVIKSGGEWISSVELENQLMSHPDVLEAVVVGVPDDKWGERPLAAVVIREGHSVTAADLRAFPRRPGGALAGTRALDVHRRGTQDVGREVRQEGGTAALREGGIDVQNA